MPIGHHVRWDQPLLGLAVYLPLALHGRRPPAGRPLAGRHPDGGSLVLHDGYTIRDDQFFVLEPTAAVELKVSRYVRADLGLAYRWIIGGSMPGVTAADVSGVGLGAVVKFGSF